MRRPGTAPKGVGVARWLTIAVLILTGCVPAGAGGQGGARTQPGATPPGSLAAPSVAPAPGPVAVIARAREGYGSLPLLFVENHGQTDPRVTHYIQGSGANVYFAPLAVTHVLRAPVETAPPVASDEPAKELRSAGASARAERADLSPWQHWAVRVELVGASPAVRPHGTTPAPTVVSYFKGVEWSWQTGLPTSTDLVYPDVWPGIDLVYESAAAGPQDRTAASIRPFGTNTVCPTA